MNIKPFRTEQWMNDHERQAVYNLTDTCVENLSVNDLLTDDISWMELPLDYGYITGDPGLKKELLKLYAVGDVDNITIAHGCSQANELVLMELLVAGDHIIVFTPGYQQFESIAESFGARFTQVPLLEEKGWMPEFAEIEAAIRPETKMVVLNNPNNPTGTLFDRAFLERLVALCRAHDLYLLSDEVYRGLEKDVPSVPDIYEKGIATQSLSKFYGVAGLRLGWIKASHEIMDRLNNRRDYNVISSGPLVDYFGMRALQERDRLMERSKALIDANKATLRKWLKDNPHFHIQIPETGTVSFLGYDYDIESKDFALSILDDKGVFFVPGWCFSEEYHLRLGLGKNPEGFRKGLALLSAFVKEKGFTLR